jgi:hypothetical protein
LKKWLERRMGRLTWRGAPKFVITTNGVKNTIRAASPSGPARAVGMEALVVQASVVGSYASTASWVGV